MKQRSTRSGPAARADRAGCRRCVVRPVSVGPRPLASLPASILAFLLVLSTVPSALAADPRPLPSPTPQPAAADSAGIVSPPAAAEADSARSLSTPAASSSATAATDSLALTGDVVLVDRIVAIVDQEMILQSDLEREMEIYQLEQEYAGEKVTEDEAQIRQEILQRLIESKLIIAAAKQADITLDEDTIKEDVEQKLKELTDHFGSREKLERELLRSGMTMADYRERLAVQLRDQQYLRAVVARFIRPKVEVLGNEVEAYYQEHLAEMPSTPDSLTLANIFIPLQPSLEARREVQRKARAALSALAQGQPFADVARQYSEGPNAARGGTVGTVQKGDLFDPTLESTIFSLEEGKVSQPIVTRRGVHIVRVDAITPAGRAFSQIFFPLEVTRQDVNAAQQAAQKAYERVKGGESFALVARELSGDPNSAQRGGELGTFRLEDLSAQFQEALKDRQAGELTEPVATPAGYYIFLVQKRKVGKRLAFEDVRETIRRTLEAQKLEAELSRYVADLRERFFVDLKG